MRLSRENRKSVRYLIIEHLVINCNKLLWDDSVTLLGYMAGYMCFSIF